MTPGGGGRSEYRVGSAPSGVEPPEMPPAPEFDRRVGFHRMHLVGMVVIALLPLLALFGVFGVSSATTAAASESLEVSVEHPTVQRFKVRHPLRITLLNSGQRSLPTVEVSLAAPYVFSFSDVAMTPGPERIEDYTYVFSFSDVAPGESRTVAAEMQAQLYWRHRGTVSWTASDDSGQLLDSGSVEFATMIWP